MRGRILNLVVFALMIPGPAVAQEVFYSVIPRVGPAINVPPDGVVGPVTPSIVVVPPGTVVRYEIQVFVQPTPALPNVNGLAGFNIALLTTLGVAQPPLDEFDSRILRTFTVFPSLGIPVGDDVLDITGRQDLAGISNPGIGLGARQLIGTGQLNTPLVEGDFEVTAVGTAELLVTAVNPSTPILVPATVGTTAGFIIQTRIAAVPDDGTTDGDELDEELEQLGANLVAACFPGAAVVMPCCLVGLLGLRRCVRKI